MICDSLIRGDQGPPNFYLHRVARMLRPALVMHIKHEIHTSYSIKQDGKEWPLQEVSEEKDLGIVTTDDLKVSRQCAEVAATEYWEWCGKFRNTIR